MENCNLTLTNSAKAHYLSLIEKTPGALGVLFFVKKAGCSGLMYQSELVFDQNPDNLSVFEDGKLKIFISRKSGPYLNGIRVDVIKKMFGQSQVVYENPNEISRCGCGESFKVKD